MSDGITIQAHPIRLSDEDLVFIGGMARTRIADYSPLFAQWLLDLVSMEQSRRIALNTEEPIEPELPKFNAATWKGSDLGNAMIACYTALQVAEDRQAVYDLLNRALFVLISWSSQRLTRLNA